MLNIKHKYIGLSLKLLINLEFTPDLLWHLQMHVFPESLIFIQWLSFLFFRFLVLRLPVRQRRIRNTLSLLTRLHAPLPPSGFLASFGLAVSREKCVFSLKIVISFLWVKLRCGFKREMRVFT